MIMKRLFFTLTLGALAVIGLNACSDDDSTNEGVEKRPYCEIEKFSVSVPNVDARIDKAKALIELYVSPDVLELLSDVKPAGELSIGATVVPSFSESQDFTKEVTYLVTAEDGKTQKTWTVKPVVSKFMAAGIGSVRKVWSKTTADLGLEQGTFTGIPTIAAFGDMVVLSRPGVILDGKTGDNTGKTLNVEGMGQEGNAASQMPFIVANDSKGNLLGATLGAFVRKDGDANFPWQVFRWTALDAKPQLVFEHSQTMTESFGRKMTVVGDIDGNAILTSYNVDAYNINQGGSPAASPAAHYCWKITNGTVDPKAELVAVPAGYRSGNMYQMLWPASASACKPFYWNDMGSAAATPISRFGYVGLDDQIVYFTGGVDPNDIPSGGKEEMFKQTGFGRKVVHTQPFTFNGVNYIAVSSYFSFEQGSEGAAESKVYLYTQLLEVSGKDYKVAYVGKEVFMESYASRNGNGTGGIAVSVVAEGSGEHEGELSCRVYNLCSGVGVVAYEIKNVKE